MGAWGYGLFESDTALDALGVIMVDREKASKTSEEFLNCAIKSLQEDGYVEADDMEYALVAAFLVDVAVNGIENSIDKSGYLQEDEHNFFKTLKSEEFLRLKDKALESIDIAISDKSELKELYDFEEESEECIAWLGQYLTLKENLLKI